ncbi:hypothetical protein AXX17_AT5G47070 [Arabidopsis thaliana]|uniref:Uncharacterized protein n=1 Tax=Arabidopsis thaliana TaxID=3702 RepID=A0A178UEZ2_ARATH|nr:hypothetical protein AXX17_AT5G47070 [Arabidopsis thaliana]
MLSVARRLGSATPSLQNGASLLRFMRTEASQPRRRNKSPSLSPLEKKEEKSEWWIVDGEMHEIGDHVPLRERFTIPRDNIPNKRRKQLREQFMRRTRLVLKESEHEPWCKKYMELYNEVRENWERLYWDEGYFKLIARDHANYESAEVLKRMMKILIHTGFFTCGNSNVTVLCAYSSILWCIDGFGSLVIAGIGVLIMIQ